MFTGLIEQQGIALAIHEKGAGLLLSVAADFDQLIAGESIAVNGVCLTLLSAEKEGLLEFDLSPETLACTQFDRVKVGDKLNLERAMPATGRFGGHYVSGHIDTTACIALKSHQQDFLELGISGFEPRQMAFLLPKGSITVNGVSLTINAVMDGVIQLMLVPHTLALTTLGHLEPGDKVNIEFDYLTRIVAHQLQVAGQLTRELER